jgi:hypothetical protein
MCREICQGACKNKTRCTTKKVNVGTIGHVDHGQVMKGRVDDLYILNYLVPGAVPPADEKSYTPAGGRVRAQHIEHKKQG